MNARCILHVGVNDVAVRDVDVREAGPGEVLIETVYSGISPGTEQRCLRGKRPGALRKVGMHGDDTRYASIVKSKSRFRVGTRYTVRLEIPGQKTIVRQVKLIDAR